MTHSWREFMRGAAAAVLLLALPGAAAVATDPAPAAESRISLDDLFATEGAADVAVSPSGRYITTVIRRKDDDLLVLFDVTSGTNKGVAKIGHKDVGERYDAHIAAIYWKSEDLMLFRVAVVPAKGVNLERLGNGDIRRLGYRLFAVDRNGTSLVRMLAQNRDAELDWAMDLGEIRSFLPRDPDHILMLVDGEDGRSLFKVNVRTGVGEVVEPARPAVWNWWLDLDGRPVVRVELDRGYLRFWRHEANDKWKRFYSVRLRELKDQDDYEPLGASDQPGKYYVLARPDGAQRRGVYLYDLEHESFGAPLAENPEFDIFSAFISRDGKRVQRYCYLAHVRICESADGKLNTHMKAIRKFFDDTANVYVVDSSEDSQTLLLFVEGPNDPPSYFWYQLSKRQIQRIGLQQEAMVDKQLPTASLVQYQARDGMKLTGYLTRPPGAELALQLPLVMMPHGGPEARDHLTFDIYVQYLAALGYAVFQPNFRGSDGFGRDFADSGHGEWGRKMQDDISDALALLVERKIVDPQRVCIVGASYGGYAALAGAELTPDLYKCVVSIAGPGNLADFLKARRKMHGADSEGYAYWKRQIGDPEVDMDRIAAVSPALHVDRIKAPILLVHGDADEIVLYEQSKDMKRLLDKSGRKTQLITLEDEGHSDWSADNERLVLKAIGEFVEAGIGPGYGRKPEAKP